MVSACYLAMIADGEIVRWCTVTIAARGMRFVESATDCFGEDRLCRRGDIRMDHDYEHLREVLGLELRDGMGLPSSWLDTGSYVQRKHTRRLDCAIRVSGV